VCDRGPRLDSERMLRMALCLLDSTGVAKPTLADSR
jgi:hypothetical protein